LLAGNIGPLIVEVIMAKVCVVGAGSMSFGLAALKGLLLAPGLDGTDVVLHDIDHDAVHRMGNLGQYIVKTKGLKTSVTASTDPVASLEGADVVVLSVTAKREEMWQQDYERGLRHGINHYAENGGPGALFHAARNLDIIMPIVRIMEQRCPDAWILNYTNPVPRICTALNRYSSMKTIGVCHQLDFGYFMAGVLLADKLGIDLPEDPRFRWTDLSLEHHHHIGLAAKKKIALLASGTNHFTWAHRVDWRGQRVPPSVVPTGSPGGEHELGGGDGLYGMLREANRTYDAGFEPFTRKVFELTGVFPTPGDTHLVEYLPFTHSPARGTWERYDIQMYDFEWSSARRRTHAELARRVIEEKELALLDGIDTERVELLTEAILTGNGYFDEAINVPNEGQVPGLPDGAIVETPGIFLPAGPRPVHCPALPAVVQEYCRRQTIINDLSVVGTIEKDRQKLIDALSLDPMIDDPELPELLVLEFLDSIAG